MGRLIKFLVLAASLGSGCAGVSEPPRDYQDLRSRGLLQLRRGDYAAARSSFEEILIKYPGQPFQQGDQLLLAGCEFRLGNHARARQLREEVARDAAFPELKRQALEGLGMMELELQDFPPAAAAFKEAAGLETRPEEQAVLLYRWGLALQRGGRFPEGREAYRQVIELAPGSKAAGQAKTQLLYPDHFAVQTGAFREAAKAESQRALLVSRGFDARVVEVEAPTGKFHCVRVGAFHTRAEAAALHDRIVTAGVIPEKSRIAVKP